MNAGWRGPLEALQAWRARVMRKGNDLLVADLAPILGGAAGRFFQPGAVDSKIVAPLSLRFAALRRWAPTSLAQAVGLVVSTALFCLAAVVLAKTFANLRFADIHAAVTETSARQFGGALLFGALSYLALAGYDFSALRQIRAWAPWRATALASFASYAVSFNLGFPLVTAPAVRFWIYSRAGLTALQVAHVTLITGVTFWLGMVVMLGLGLIVGAAPLAAIDGIFAPGNVLLGAVVLATIAGYCLWTARAPRKMNLRGHLFELPGWRAALTQMALGATDIFCAAATLYVLLPAGCDIDFAPFMAIYVFACLLGVISHAPGGIGVFEATLLHALPGVSAESLVASLLLFRAIYYLLPLALALGLLWAHQNSRSGAISDRMESCDR